MSDLRTPAEPRETPAASHGLRSVESAIFGGAHGERSGLPPVVWGVAALIVVLIVGVLIFVGHTKPAPVVNTLQPEDAYASSLPLTQLAMSESESLSGGKLTYLDGRIQNTGQKTVTAVAVQVVFANDESLAPHIETLPLTLIRTRQPYIDTEPVSADPLKPGENREFRLIFERVPENWNTQMPQIRIIHTTSR